MTSRPRIGVLAGSLRAGSINRQLATWLVAHPPADTDVEPISIDEVPLFDQDIEDGGDPGGVVVIKDRVRSVDGIIITSPEYNGSVPAVTKNALDWLSRPPREGPIWNKPVAYIVATPGRHGGTSSRELAQRVVGIFGGLFEETLGVGSFNHVFADGVFTEPSIEAEVTSFVARFVDHVVSGT